MLIDKIMLHNKAKLNHRRCKLERSKEKIPIDFDKQKCIT